MSTNAQQNKSANKNKYKISYPLDAIIKDIKDKNKIIYLDKLKIKPIFKWIKSRNVSDAEMLKTFNCGVGFCLITKKNKVDKVKKYFSKEFKPYVIGQIIKNKKNKILLNEKIRW